MSKKWSFKYDKCVECDTTERRHKALGFCTLCYYRQRRGKNRERLNEYNRLYKQRPHVKEKTKEFEQRPEIKARRREYSRRWRERNPERYLEVLADWRARNQDKVKSYNARPDVKERNRRRWLNKKYGDNGFVVLERDNYSCQRCDSKKQIQIHHIDWNKENNELDNLILLCNSCHQKLHTFVPKEFRRRIFEVWIVLLVGIWSVPESLMATVSLFILSVCLTMYDI